MSSVVHNLEMSMRGFVKLFTKLLDSTAWVGRPAYVKLAWITILLKADPRGRVTTPVPGLAKAAEITVDEMLEAISILSEPDPYSESKERDGRRLVPLDDERVSGFLVVNHGKYRKTDTTALERKRNQRSREICDDVGCHAMSRRDISKNTSVTQAEAEAEAEAEADLPPCSPSPEPLKLEVVEPKQKTRRKRPVGERPAGWAPKQSHLDFAKAHGIDLSREVPKFCDRHDSTGTLFADWDKAFWTWLHNWVEFRKPKEPVDEVPNEERRRAQEACKAAREQRTKMVLEFGGDS